VGIKWHCALTALRVYSNPNSGQKHPIIKHQLHQHRITIIREVIFVPVDRLCFRILSDSDKADTDSTTIKVMAETPDAAQQDQTTHCALFPAEEACPLTDEFNDSIT
jgi:hypothetical protein